MNALVRENIRFIIALAASALLFAFALSTHSGAKEELVSIRAQSMEIGSMKAEFQTLKARTDTLEARIALARASGVTQAVDEVFSSVGLKDRIKSLKQLGTEDLGEAIKQEVQVRAEGLNVNEAANVLYAVQSAPMLMSVKKLTMKKSFDEPDLLELTVTLAFVKRK